MDVIGELEMLERVQVGIKRLPGAEGIDTPGYETNGSAGIDLPAAVPLDRPLELGPGEIALVPTGFAIALPLGYEAQVRPRSGFAAKHGITVLNAPGTVDSDYRGEIKVILINHGSKSFQITRSMRIAQLVIAPVRQAQWVEMEELDRTKRGEGGFGSTGLAGTPK